MRLDSTLLVFLVIFLGALLLWLARWARQKNSDLRRKHGRFFYEDFPVDLWHGRASQAVRKYFLGDMDALDSGIGTVLAAAVIVVVMATLLIVLAVVAWA